MQSEAITLAKMQARENDKQRIAQVLGSPGIMGLAILAGGLYAANKIQWDEDETRNADVRAVVSAGAVLAGLSQAGVKDKWILGITAGAAGLSGLEAVTVDSGIAKEIIDVGASTAIGAAIGTAIFPVVGTVIGGAVGGGAGYGLYRATGGK
jgi:hypothetical protein